MENKENSKLQPGVVLKGSYRLLEEIGSGGGGIVYKAYHESLRKYVVVKQIRDTVKEYIDIRGEADILKNLRNSYLPQVYDFDKFGNIVYTVIDYVEGESLDKVLEKEGRFQYKEVLKWANQLADALAYLHSQNPPVIHSDIKPANIILTKNRDICLIDFNISLALDRKKNISTGTSEGYSPPEQYHSVQAYRDYLNGEYQASQENWKADAAAPRIGNNAVRETKRAWDNGATGNSQERHTSFTNQGKPAGNGPGTSFAWGNSGEPQGKKRLTKMVQRQAPIALETSGYDGRYIETLIGRGVDARSDIYSLGATLYHLLTGFYPETDFERIVPLSRCSVHVSDGFRRIIEKMMRLDPRERFQNGGELLEALKGIRKYDQKQSVFRAYCVTSAIIVAILWLAGAGLVLAGTRVRGQEKVNAYNQELEYAVNQIYEGNFEEAERYIDSAIESIPTRIDAYSKRVLMLYYQGNYQECIDYGRDAVNSPPYYIQSDNDKKTLGDILFIMGDSYYELEDYSNAVNCLDMAVSYNPGNGAYYRDLGIALARAGNTERALEALDQALSLGIEQGSAYMLQGEIAYAEGDAGKAVELFLQALDLIDDQSLQRRCVMLCARAYEKMGDAYQRQEIEFLENWSQTFGPTNSLQLAEKLADLYARNGQMDKALEIFQDMKDSGYMSYQLFENIAILLQQTDRLEEAEEILTEMVSQYPDRYETYKRLAFLEADKQQRKENSERDYGKMREYYETARQLYQNQANDDGEMWQLDNMIEELTNGGWFE